VKFLREQDVIRSSDEFENGCIPMRSDSVPIARWVVFSRPSVCGWVGVNTITVEPFETLS